jgi:hypothetical protein
MLKTAVGHSNDPDSLEAIGEILAQCRNTLGEQIPQAGILFAAVDFDCVLILQEIDRAFPNIELIGCTTDGELSSILEFQQDSLTLTLFYTDTEEIEIRAAVGRNISQNPEEIARSMATEAKRELNLPIQFGITLPESLTTSVVSILTGLEAALENVPIFGGAAADRWEMKQTYQFYKTEVLTDAVPILLFAGDFHFSYGIAGGWHPIGKRSQITKVDKNIIYEIDNKSALDFYHYYLNDYKPDSAYPLAVFPPDEERFFLRGSISYDLLEGSVKVSGDVPEGSMVQITHTTLEDVVNASAISFNEALSNYSGSEPEAVICFSCAWRRQVMGTRANEEYQALAPYLKKKIAACGFYTYGEIAPFRDNGQNFFHNTTFLTLLLGN